MVSMQDISKKFKTVYAEIHRAVIGQDEVVEQMMAAILCNGHAFVEGYPGLAKTLLVKTISEVMDLRFSRIQGTPDLLPSDITGTYIIDETHGKKEFKFQPGPIFANIVLIDEVNRATPKSHSAVLEAMQERQVTVGNSTYKLEEPFFVLATGNPIEQEGVSKLSEAQLDRFLFKINIGYPKIEDELKIVEKYSDKDVGDIKLRKIFSKDDVLKLQSYVRQIPVANDIRNYAVYIMNKTRNSKDMIEYGASPRASVNLILAAKARALMNGRKYVSKEDIQFMSFPVLRHRIILSFEAERKGLSQDDVIKEMLKR